MQSKVFLFGCRDSRIHIYGGSWGVNVVNWGIVAVNAFIYSTLIAFLTMGFNLTYQTARIPNWAHGTFAALGVFVTLWVTRIWDMHTYLAVPISFLIVAALGVVVYLGVIYTLKRAGAPEILLLISTIAVDIILIAILNIQADYIQDTFKLNSRGFLLRDEDIDIPISIPGVYEGVVPGVLLISTGLLIAFTVFFLILLYKTKFGMAMRATVENPDLAEVIGVNVDKINLFSWFITGGMAGVAGALLPLWFRSYPAIGSLIIINVFAASILGGVRSLLLAILATYAIGFVEIIGTAYLSTIIPQIGGVSTASYRPLIPLMILLIALMIIPEGFYGLWERYSERKIAARREVST